MSRIHVLEYKASEWRTGRKKDFLLLLVFVIHPNLVKKKHDPKGRRKCFLKKFTEIKSSNWFFLRSSDFVTFSSMVEINTILDHWIMHTPDSWSWWYPFSMCFDKTIFGWDALYVFIWYKHKVHYKRVLSFACEIPQIIRLTLFQSRSRYLYEIPLFNHLIFEK